MTRTYKSNKTKTPDYTIMNNANLLKKTKNQQMTSPKNYF